MPWYAVQVSYYGEKEDALTLKKTMHRVVGKSLCEVFIPCHRAEGSHYTKDFYLMEGYAFARFEGDPIRLFRLEEDPFFESVVSTPSKDGRVPEVISDKTIQEIRDRMKGMLNPNDIVVGDAVVALDGIYRSLEGKVESVDGNLALVSFTLYSKERKDKIPLFCLKRVGEVSNENDAHDEYLIDDEEDHH